jgi:hypothetical protein
MTPGDINNPCDPRNKRRTRESRMQVRSLLLGWDPLGVADSPNAIDEYDCMISPLLHLLSEGANKDAIERWIGHELVNHFGMGVDGTPEAKLAADLVSWWKRSAEEAW